MKTIIVTNITTSNFLRICDLTYYGIAVILRICDLTYYGIAIFLRICDLTYYGIAIFLRICDLTYYGIAIFIRLSVRLRLPAFPLNQISEHSKVWKTSRYILSFHAQK